MKIITGSFWYIIVFIFFSCNSTKMGKTKYGKDGRIESGTAIKRCTHPTKRYAKGLEIKVKEGIDSVALLPSQNMEAELTQTVTRLSDYSSEGLDIDLILFRLCEISINNNFSKNETDSLIQTAIDAWSKKNSSK